MRLFRGITDIEELMMSKMKVLQISAAQPGWVAQFQSEGNVDSVPVAVWAVVEDEHGQRITGFSETDGCGFFEADDERDGFDGWCLLSAGATDEARIVSASTGSA